MICGAVRVVWVWVGGTGSAALAEPGEEASVTTECMVVHRLRGCQINKVV